VRFRFSDIVLTSADGQTVYGKSITFIEDLAIIEEALNNYDSKFRLPA
jgi:hypothetical protein